MENLNVAFLYPKKIVSQKTWLTKYFYKYLMTDLPISSSSFLSAVGSPIAENFHSPLCL